MSSVVLRLPMYRLRWLAPGLCLLMGLYAQAAWSATINGVRVWRAPDHTRIVLDLDGPVQHKLSLAIDPERVILDLTNATLKSDVQGLPLADTPVSMIRTS